MNKFVLLTLTFSLSTVWLLFLVQMAPVGKKYQKEALYFPRSIDELKILSASLKMYYEDNLVYVMVLFCSAYLYKQAFMIPGSALLNILAGALFGIKIALPLCCILTSIGATCSFLMSQAFAEGMVRKLWPEKIEYLRAKVNDNSHRLIYYLLFLRLFPMTPNCLLNLISPIIDVPIHLFFVSVLIGLIPYNFLCVQAGYMLASITSQADVFTFRMLFQLAIMAMVALGPSFVMKTQGCRKVQANGSTEGWLGDIELKIGDPVTNRLNVM